MRVGALVGLPPSLAEEALGEMQRRAGFCTGSRGQGEILRKRGAGEQATEPIGGRLGAAVPEAGGDGGGGRGNVGKTAPASKASSGRRRQVSGARTNWRLAPSICFAARGRCSASQRSR